MKTTELKERLKDNREILTFTNEKDLFDIGCLTGKIRISKNGKFLPKRNTFGKFWTIKDIQDLIKENKLQLEEL